MSKQKSYLNYEFYFLFQTELEYNGKHYTEPVSLSNKFIECKENLYSSKKIDKRLFRYDSTSSDLAQWDKDLQQGWEHILACYTNHFKQNNFDITDKEIKTFCEQAFMGVALVIMDETVEHHQIQINTDKGEVIFKPSVNKTPTEKILLQVEEVVPNGLDSKDCMSKPAHLEEFEIDNYNLSLEDWYIQLSSTQQPCLKPVQEGENPPNPVFRVYGLAHGKLEPVGADWPDQLQAFLSGGKSSVLFYVMLRLIMLKWQFMRLHFDSVRMRKKLDIKNNIYKQQDDDNIASYSNQKLGKGLRDITTLSFNAKQVLARLDAGIRTLEINCNNFERELGKRREVWQTLEEYPQIKRDWNLTWEQNSDAPMLDKFNLNIRNLQNQATYIKDSLIYLDSIRAHWQLHIDERRLKVNQELKLVIQFLVFLVVLGEIILLGNNNGINNPSKPVESSDVPHTILYKIIDFFLRPIEGLTLIKDVHELLQRPSFYISIIGVLISVFIFKYIFKRIPKILSLMRKIRKIFRQ